MSSTPSVNPPTPGAIPAGAPQKKSNALLWILGIFGGIVLFIILAVAGISLFFVHKVKEGLDSELMKKNPELATAKLVATMNPDLEIVSSDDSSGTIVVHNKKDGKTLTMKFDPQKKSMVIQDDSGKESVKFSGGNNTANIEITGKDNSSVKIGASADKAPDWVPAYPGATVQNTMSVTENGKRSGSFVFVTADGADKVISYYSDELKTSGFTVSTTTGNTNGKISGMVGGEDKDNNRNVAVILGQQDDGTHVSVTFGEKKQAQ